MSPLIYFLDGLILGAVVGGLISWLVGGRLDGGSDDRLASELHRQIGQRESELASLRSELTDASNARASAEARCAASEKMLEDQQSLQNKALVELRDAFKALSADALKQTAPEFLRLANETLARFQESAKGDLEKRQESIKVLVEPLKQQLEAYQKRLQQNETAQAATLGEVRKQLESLSQSSQSLAQETQQFRMVLRSNQARGRWGEETLRRIVEAAGMSPHSDFVEQVKEGDGKPDLVVKLPGERVIIVDAKVPDFDFLNALETADSMKRAESLAAHAAKLKTTIKALADRDYPAQFSNALDYVVLFLPAESLFSAALEGDRDLMIWAQTKRIILATPSSLIAILRSVSLSWQQHAQTENAQKIAEAARELFARVMKFNGHFEKIRAGLERANNAFHDAAASFQTRVRPAGERLAELRGGSAGNELADVQSLDNTLRPPNESSA